MLQVGPDWQQVINKISRGRYLPLLLVYGDHDDVHPAQHHEPLTRISVKGFEPSSSEGGWSEIYGNRKGMMIGSVFNKSLAVAEIGDHLATIDMGHKEGGAAVPLSVGGVGSPCNTMSPGPRPTSVPSGILIHPAVWPQQTWAKNLGAAVPF